MHLQLMGRATRIYIYFYIIGNIFISPVTIEALSGILESLPGKLLELLVHSFTKKCSFLTHSGQCISLCV